MPMMALRKIFGQEAQAPVSALETHLADIIEAYRIDTILDAGANEGQFGLKMRKLGFGGDMYSFEPVRRTYEKLQKNAAGDRSWKLHNIALGTAPGQLQMNVAQSSDFSSALAPNDFGKARFKGIQTAQSEDVAVHRLDDFIRQAFDPAQKRILLKIDTQGYDLQVFAGAAGLRDSICALVSELSLIPIYHGMTHYLETLAVYEKSGLHVSGMYPVSRNKENLSVIEMDCVMVDPAKKLK